MKKVLVSMMTIALVSALIGGGIYAAFTDTEEGEIEFRAGTIDLTVDGTSAGFELKFEDLYPAAGTKQEDYALRNIGSLLGDLKIELGTIVEPAVKGTLGMASGGSQKDGETPAKLTASVLGEANPDIVEDPGYWVGYYLFVYDRDGEPDQTVVVTGFSIIENVATFEVDGTWGDVPIGDDKFALKTEHEDDAYPLSAGINVAFFLSPTGVWEAGATGLKSDGTTYAWSDGTPLDRVAFTSYDEKTWSDASLQLSANQTLYFCVSWEFNPAANANKYQGGSLDTTLDFTLTQVTS